MKALSLRAGPDAMLDDSCIKNATQEGNRMSTAAGISGPALATTDAATNGKQSHFSYLTERVDDQIAYFRRKAETNQALYRFLKSSAILCNVLTTMAIALSLTVPEEYKVPMVISALVLSTAVLATYQWEEFHNYGAKWEKFRLAEEQLKSEKYLFLNGVGPYCQASEQEKRRLFVATVENVIRDSDLSYFSLMIEAGKRIEKRM